MSRPSAKGLRRAPLPAFSLAVILFLYLPLVIVIINAFNKDELLTHWGGFTFKWVSQAVNSSRVRHDFVTSAIVAVASSAISLAIAIPAGLWARRVSPRARRVLDATTYMRIVLPEIVAALGLLIFFRRLNVPLGMAAVIIGHVVFNSAYVTVIIQARLATLTTVLEDAAADLGAKPRRVFQRVTFPFLLPAVLVGGMVAFTFSFDDVITSSFLGGNSTETLPMLIFGLARFRVDPEVNAIGAGLMVITLSALALTLVVAGGRVSGGLLLRTRASRASE